ncbi:hypothetical protein C8R47DRAFT_1088138 [Mycena vitilis]|nr:hypothetical protein C8R47DRAFT_1088138 [Mycena vitilis]
MAYNQQHYPPPGAPPPGQYQQGGHPGPQGGYPAQHGGYPAQQGGYNAPPAQAYNAPHGQHAPQNTHVGGFAAQAPPDPRVLHLFSAVDQDRSGSIGAKELQLALVNGNYTQFDLDTVKMLMSIFDTPKVDGTRDGVIDVNEFGGLWNYIQEWQGVFRHFDHDNSGSIEGRELPDALSRLGFSQSPPVVALIHRKYAVPPAAGHHTGPTGITFDRFIRACVVVKQATEFFQRLDTDRDGWIQISYDGFMNAVLSLP